jgi:hypothetical protein
MSYGQSALCLAVGAVIIAGLAIAGAVALASQQPVADQRIVELSAPPFISYHREIAAEPRPARARVAAARDRAAARADDVEAVVLAATRGAAGG